MYFRLQNLTARRYFEYSYVSKNAHRQAYDYGHIVCAASCCQWLEMSFLSLETGLWITGLLSILAQTGPLAFSPPPPALSQVLIQCSRKEVSFKVNQVKREAKNCPTLLTCLSKQLSSLSIINYKHIKISYWNEHTEILLSSSLRVVDPRQRYVEPKKCFSRLHREHTVTAKSLKFNYYICLMLQINMVYTWILGIVIINAVVITMFVCNP